MNRSIYFVGALVIFIATPANAATVHEKKQQATACQPARFSHRGGDGTIRALHAEADSGNVEAMNALAIMYAQGVGVPKSACMALKLFRQSATEGYTPAMVNLGMMRALSNGTRRDGRQAYAWIRAALYVGVPEHERDATFFKLGIVASRLDVSQVERAEAVAKQIARSVILHRTAPAEKDRDPADPRSTT